DAGVRGIRGLERSRSAQRYRVHRGEAAAELDEDEDEDAEGDGQLQREGESSLHGASDRGLLHTSPGGPNPNRIGERRARQRSPGEPAERCRGSTGQASKYSANSYGCGRSRIASISFACLYSIQVSITSSVKTSPLSRKSWSFFRLPSASSSPPGI